MIIDRTQKKYYTNWKGFFEVEIISKLKKLSILTEEEIVYFKKLQAKKSNSLHKIIPDELDNSETKSLSLSNDSLMSNYVLDYKKLPISKKIKCAYFNYIRTFLLFLFFIICALLSLIIIVCELTLFLNTNINVFGIAINTYSNDRVAIFFLTAIPLLYFSLSSFSTLFQVKIGFYHITEHSTENLTMIYLLGFICQSVYSILFNFILMLKLNKSTKIEQLLGEMKQSPRLIKNFLEYYPLILILLCVLNIFNFFQKIITCFGFSNSFYINDRMKDDIIKEGDKIAKQKLLAENN